ncbi:MAG: HD domain-containing phosphohydrolase [Burkholderiales bacterium]
MHPHVGQLLVTQLTNYPANVARAIAEHHERLDGSGYPHCLMGDAISPLGKLTAVTEATLNALRKPQSQLAHASVALRVVPGEFDLTWVGPVTQAVRTQPPLQCKLEASEVAYRWQGLDHALQAAQRSTEALLKEAQSAPLHDAMGLAEHLLARLRTGWNASGLWSQQDMTEQDVAELEAVEAELMFRLRSIRRAALLRAGTLTGEEAQAMEQWGQALSVLR